MRKEPLVYYAYDQPYIYGYEILAENPSLIKDIKDDFYVFKSNILLLKDIFDKDKVYHFNIQGETLLKFEKDIFNLINSSPYKENIILELLEQNLNSSELDRIFEIVEREKIRVSLDDFGTVSSNFDRLINYKNLIESVKIDRILWENMLSVVSEIVKFCEDNNIKVICEKVETQEELNNLIHIGVRYFQGWYFKKIKLKEHKKKVSLDREKIAQLSQKAYDITAKTNSNLSYDEFLENLKLLLIAYDLDIKFGSVEFFKLKDLMKQNQDSKNLDTSYFTNRTITILKELKAQTLYKIKELKNLIYSIKNVAYDIKSDILFDALKNLEDYRNFLKQKIIEQEFALSTFKNFDFYQNRKKIFKDELLRKFSAFEKRGEDFFVGCIYLKGLFEEIQSGNSISLLDINNILEKLNSILKLFFGESIFIIQTEEFIVNFIVQKKLKDEALLSLNNKLDKQEFLIKGKPINLKAKINIVRPSEEDKSFEDFILRLEIATYEMKFY